MHVASHIASQTNGGMALVTDSKGALSSSVVTGDELAHVAAVSTNIQQQLTSKLGSKEALTLFQPMVMADSLSLSSVKGLVTYVIEANMATALANATTAALTARIV